MKSKKEKETLPISNVTSKSSKKDKLKAAEDAIASITKQFGKGAIMRLGDGPGDFIEVIPSGSMALDYALGIGGFPRGRIIEIYGPEMSGKCQSEDSYVLTANGYKTVAEIFKEQGLPLTTSCKQIPIIYPLLNRYMQVENTTHFTYNGKKSLKEIITRTGFKLKRTYKHPLLSFSPDGNIIWKWAGEIEVGDYLLRRRGEYFGNKQLDKDIAYGLGVVIADGTLSNENSLQITNDDPDIIDFIENSICKVFELTKFNKYNNNEKGSYSYGFTSSQNCRDFYKKFDIKVGIAKDKVIPKEVRELDKESLTEFIKGYMDCECNIGVSGLEVCSASYELLYQLKLILTQFQINSFLKKSNSVKGYEYNDYWLLYINGKDFRRYCEVIGTNSERRREQISLHNYPLVDNTNYDSIPYINDKLRDLYYMQEKRTISMLKQLEDLRYDKVQCTSRRLGKILEVSEDNYLKQYLGGLLDYYFEEVVEVKDIPSERTFDFAMEKTATFIADGIINHNTTLCLHTIAEAQKKGGLAAFVDAEHALDVVYAKALGVDTDNLLISQPDYGEQALEIVDTLVRSNSMDIIVIDSVAALVPRSELEGDMGDSHMAVQARLMSQALRKLTGIIAKSKTSVIFINQLRQKIGVFFGNPESTTGGNALKFYASVRIDIRRTASLKAGEEVVGNKTKIKVVKSKVSAPFREVEVDILFGKGINKYTEVIDLGIAHNIIKKTGAWYTIGEDRFQGREGVIDALTSDDVMFQVLRQQVAESLNAKLDHYK